MGGEEPRRLTDGDFDESMPAWHPDADRIAFVTDRGARQGLDPGSDVYEVSLDGELTQLVERGGWLLPVYSPEGDLHVVGDPELDYPRLHGLWKVGADGVANNVFPDLDRSVTSLGGGVPSLPRWSDDFLYVTVEEWGRVEIRAFDADGPGRVVVSGDRLVTGFDVGPRGEGGGGGFVTNRAC